MFQSIDLIEDCISTPIQSVASNVKYPCTGFCYMAIENKSLLINYFKRSLYSTYDNRNYHDLIHELITKAGRRKGNNNKINHEGEFINQATILEDFPDIYNNTDYKEYGISTNDPLSVEIFENNMFMDLIQIPIDEYIIVNRSNETFLLLKIDSEKFLVVDSHQPRHGTLDIYNAIKYITRNGKTSYVQVGLFKI